MKPDVSKIWQWLKSKGVEKALSDRSGQPKLQVRTDRGLETVDFGYFVDRECNKPQQSVMQQIVEINRNAWTNRTVQAGGVRGYPSDEDLTFKEKTRKQELKRDLLIKKANLEALRNDIRNLEQAIIYGTEKIPSEFHLELPELYSAAKKEGLNNAPFSQIDKPGIDQDTLIDKFRKACIARGLQKGKTIPAEELYEICKELKVPGTGKLKEFKLRNRAYYEAREYASRLGYKRGVAAQFRKGDS